MSNRNNQTNTGGITAISGGNMPANNFTNADTYISRLGAGNNVVTPTVTANGHAVEQDGDGGCWDTVSGVIVNIDKTNIGAPNL